MRRSKACLVFFVVGPLFGAICLSMSTLFFADEVVVKQSIRTVNGRLSMGMVEHIALETPQQAGAPVVTPKASDHPELMLSRVAQEVVAKYCIAPPAHDSKDLGPAGLKAYVMNMRKRTGLWQHMQERMHKAGKTSNQI